MKKLKILQKHYTIRTECGSAYTFDDAYENDFICKECGSL